MLDRISQLYVEWKSLQPLRAEYQKVLDEKFRLEFNYNSNHMEGNTLTYGQTKLLLIFDQTEGNHELREYEEMKAHDVALKMIIEEAKDKERPLTENFVRTLNKTILVRPFWKDAQTSDGQNTRMEVKVGEYKSRPNHVRTAAGETFHYAGVAETPVMMRDLVDWYNTESEKGELTPLELAALLHYRYIRIHPFEDGNGRVARLLVNYVLFRYDYPMVIIKTKDKNNYLRTLNRCDVEVGLDPVHGAKAKLAKIQPFVEYVGAQLAHSLQIAIKAGKGESIEEEDDVQKEITLLKQKILLKGKLTKHPLLVYKVFVNLSKNIIVPIRKALEQFESMFGEVKECHFVNDTDEIFEDKHLLKQEIFRSPLLISNAPKKYQVFGFDIYENDIERIKWEFNYFGLKGAKNNPTIEISVEIKGLIFTTATELSENLTQIL